MCVVADEDHLLLVERADAELWTPGAFASSDESLRPNHADRFGNDDLGTPGGRDLGRPLTGPRRTARPRPGSVTVTNALRQPFTVRVRSGGNE
ncbi:hypothetical protein [Haloarchaeobius iranensis]|uniref:hypothetical protein n=1 Tax=Haloarchaeobius iranensis TaxID=996166 RepID=UPI00362C3294